MNFFSLTSEISNKKKKEKKYIYIIHDDDTTLDFKSNLSQRHRYPHILYLNIAD